MSTERLKSLYERRDTLDAQGAALQTERASVSKTIEAIEALLNPKQLGLAIPGLDEATDAAPVTRGPGRVFTKGQIEVLVLARSRGGSCVPPTKSAKRSARSLTDGDDPSMKPIAEGGRETGVFELTEAGKRAADMFAARVGPESATSAKGALKEVSSRE